MNGSAMSKNRDWQRVVGEVRESTRPDIEKLVYAFGWITAGIIERAKHDIDAAAAIKDQQTLVKHQLKMEVMNHARGIFQECHILATGRKAWDE